MLLKNQVAIVTGGASTRGIGWATAKRFADEGARVVILGLDASAAQSAAAAIGDQHLGFACDVRDEAACQAIVQKIISDLGQVDILVNNAGVSQSYRLMDSSQSDYDLVMDASVRGAYNMSRAVVPHFRSRKSGAIVCICSVAAQRGGGILGGPHYSAAKGAVQTLAKAMARELWPDGIRVNAIAPGMVDTDLLVGKIDEDGKKKGCGNHTAWPTRTATKHCKCMPIPCVRSIELRHRRRAGCQRRSTYPLGKHRFSRTG